MRKHVSDFLEAVHAAQWQDRMHSKFHWLLHFGSHLEKWGFMVQCYTHERKHRTIKRFAEDIQKTSAYEQGLLREVLDKNFIAWQDTRRIPKTKWAAPMVAGHDCPRRVPSQVPAACQGQPA